MHQWQDWSLGDLLDAKTARGTTISLVLPARDEAATVGAVVAGVREALVERAPLLDEVVVVDSDSVDDTARVARDAGAVVHRSRDVRPDLGSFPGKGEAMWKSMFVTRGDLVVFMDADLVEWDPHFVTGLLGPLLTTPAVQLVKGCYERPFVSGGASVPHEGGGRVTELVARPLLALVAPELADLVQPLAGEWAVRRALFESLHVPTGYAVEVAALLDAARAHGRGAITQVDLGRRTHRHQSLAGLGVMATQVTAAVWSRSGGSPLPGMVTLRRHVATDVGFEADDREVGLGERPPVTSVRG